MANCSEQDMRLAPCVNLYKAHATFTSKGTAFLNLIFWRWMWGTSMWDKFNRLGLLIQKISIHLESSYSKRKKRENHVVLQGFNRQPTSRSSRLPTCTTRKSHRTNDTTVFMSTKTLWTLKTSEMIFASSPASFAPDDYIESTTFFRRRISVGRKSATWLGSTSWGMMGT